MIVLMQNDYPVGIYSTVEKAERAAKAHYERVYDKPWLKDSGHQSQKDYHYRQYWFEVDDGVKE